MFATTKSPSGVISQYQISRSLRFNSADSAYLSRTFGTPTNANVWTFSCWVKRSAFGVFGTILGRVGSLYPIYQFISTTSTFGVYDSGSTATTAVFRDPSAWYHLVIQRTDSTTVTVYFNGVSQLVATGQTNAFNLSGSTYSIGKADAGEYFDGYMTEVNFIDGQALTPSSFGYTNSSTGVWNPIPYSGTYGTNGFYLNFSDNSNTTAATLGADYSGNGNNWTPNNFSVTAGVGNDSLVDVPTLYGVDTGVGGTVRGNYATLNPLDVSGTGTILDGNLQLNGSSGAWYQSRCGFGLTSGKWYWEVYIVATNEAINGICIGIANSSVQTAGYNSANQWSYNNNNGGRKCLNTVSTAYGTAFITADTVGVAFDADAGSITFYVNNSSQGVAASSGLPNPAFPTVSAYGTDKVAINFGQRPFAYTAPSGFKALCTQNLPTPTIGATSATLANKYFDINLWTGNGTSQTLTNSGGFQPDWVWLKYRNSGTNFHNLYDVLRGATKHLFSNSTAAEGTNASALTAFTSTGFSVGNDNDVNQSSGTYVGWQWKAGGTGVSNTAGSITSTVSASTASGFSIVTYTGNAAAAATVGHGLGATPAMVIVKSRNLGAENWPTWHQSLGANTYWVRLDQTIATNTNANRFSGFSSTTFTLGVAANTETNGSGDTYVAYCFAAIAGYSAFGSYTGNGSADGPFVYTGFRPAFVMMKRTDSTGNWPMIDSSRIGYNIKNYDLYANLSQAEATSTVADLLSNGFKLRWTSGEANASGGTYIYMAFASNPFKYSLAR